LAPSGPQFLTGDARPNSFGHEAQYWPDIRLYRITNHKSSQRGRLRGAVWRNADSTLCNADGRWAKSPLTQQEAWIERRSIERFGRIR
jgi:hypothetical protein